MTMSIGSVFVSSLSTMVLQIFPWPILGDYHYNLFKAYGCFYAFLAPCPLAMMLFVPPSLNLIGFLLIHVIFWIMATFYHKFKRMCLLDWANDNNFPHMIKYIGLVVPLAFVLVLFLSDNLDWIVYSVHYTFFGITMVDLFISYTSFDSKLKQHPSRVPTIYFYLIVSYRTMVFSTSLNC